MSTVKNVSKKVPSKKSATSKVNNEEKLKKKLSDKPEEEKKLLIKKLTKKEASKTSTNRSTHPKNSTTPSNSSTGNSSSRISKSQYFPSKNLFSNALKSMEISPLSSSPKSVTNPIKNTSNRKPYKTLSKTLQSTEDASVSSSISTPRSVSERTKDNFFKPSSKAVSNALKSKHTPPESSPKSTVIKRTKDSSALKSSSKPKLSSKPKPSTTKSSPDTSDRPRTATLTKGSIVNDNIVGPEAPIPVKFIPVTADEENYEEDFESYESDFEAATSSSDDTNLVVISRQSGSISSSSSSERVLPKAEETRLVSAASAEGERKLDSGTFELSDFKHRQILKYIEDSIKREDAIIEADVAKEKCNHASLSDEGFEDQKSLQFINFTDAKKKCEKRRASAARRKRGQELFSMIKLDTMDFTIFDSPSISYEEFIKTYGQSSTVQASTQYGDDWISEEVQTEKISVNDTWTQMPQKFSSFNIADNSDFWSEYCSEFHGVAKKGCDTNTHDENRLKNFLDQSAELVFQILSEDLVTEDNEKRMTSKSQMPFSDRFLQLNTSELIFEDTTVKSVSIHPNNCGQILTVHVKNHYAIDGIKSVVGLWDLKDLERPRDIFCSFGSVSCVVYSLNDDRSVVGGQDDGLLLLWCLQNTSQSYNANNRTPIFITPLGTSHFAKVVAIELLKRSSSNHGDGDEICSLDDTGTIIIWTLIYTSKSTPNLLGNMIINLQELYPQFQDFSCTDWIIIDSHIYVSTSHGVVLQCLVNGKLRGPKYFLTESKVSASCLGTCPFSRSHFLVGYSNGDLSLFSCAADRPILKLQNKDETIDGSAVRIVKWSKTKPFVIFAYGSDGNVHIWDLSKSDMYPEYSIKFSERISCLKLSEVLDRQRNDMFYMLLGTENGKVFLHFLNKDYGRDTEENFNRDLNVFRNYLTRL